MGGPKVGRHGRGVAVACDMCANGGKVHRAAAEIFDDSYARRPYGADAMAELTADCGLWIETPIGDGHGNRYTILLPVAFCPWCGEKLEDTTEWEVAGE